MSVNLTSDEDLLRRLPLPLAQLYRRARNGKTPVDRHHNAYYLAEATLKLAASLRIGSALQAGLDHHSPLARSLEQLCLPSVGQWVGFLRDSSEYLHARPDAALLPMASAHEALTRHEALPAVREFAERASTAVDGEDPPITPQSARDASRRGVLGFFDLIASYRNQVFGHAAQRPSAFYDELGSLLLAASAEILRQDALFGGLTLAVGRLTSGDSARSIRAEWLGLQGTTSLMLSTDAVGPEPDPSDEAARKAAGSVFFVARGVRVPLHPLVVYHEDRSERERVGFLNKTVEASRSARGGEVRRCDYLDYATGDLIREVDARRELTELLARLRGRPATPTDVDRVILESQAESGEVPTPPLAAGAIIGDFVLEGVLGQGGMGVVYRARQRSLNRTVALKVLPPSMAADPVSLGRFRREIAALARCDHPNLVKILTSGADGDRHFYAMELVEGMDLAALFEVLAAWNRSARGHLREGHLPAAVSTSSDMARRRHESQPAEAEPLPALEPVAPAPPPELESGRTLFECLGTLFADAADALAHLHSRGVIHRDIKPANLMLTLDGRRLVVMDLGLAQLRDRSQSLTADGVKFVGTLRYTSPEQLQRNLLEVNERTDVYGLGATLYEMATLAPIFDGDTPNRLIEQVLHQEPRTPRAIEPVIPRDLAAIALHCLDKDRSQRYANARDLAQDLRHFASGEPVTVREPGKVERALKWARRKPTLAAVYMLGFLSVFLGGLGGTAVWQWRSAEIAKAEAEWQRGKFERLEYGRTVEVAHQEWRDNNIAASRALLDRIHPNLRGWEWHYVHRLCHSDLLTINTKSNTAFSAAIFAAFSPDGSRIVTSGADATAKVWNARSGTELQTLRGHFDSVISAAFSPDGSRIVTASHDKTAKIWDVRTGASILTLTGHTDFLHSAAFSPDGTRIVTGCADATAKVWDAKSGTETFTLKGHAGVVSSATYNSDGSRILTASYDKTAKIWDAKNSCELATLKGHTNNVTSAAFSPDGSQIATGSKDSTAKVWDVRTGAVIRTLRGHFDSVISAAFSPDGSRIVTASHDKTAKIWDVRTGASILTLTGHTDFLHSAAFSPDGTRIVTVSRDMTAKIWDATSGAEALAIEDHSDPFAWAKFTPDGSHVVTGSYDRLGVMRDIRSGVMILTNDRLTNLFNPHSFSPDGLKRVTGSWNGVAIVQDAKSDTAILTLRGHTGVVEPAAFSPDGSQLITVSNDKTAKVWDAKSGAEILTLRGHVDGVCSAAFSPDGSRIVTASHDKTAKIWDVRTGSSILTLTGHTDSVDSVAFSPDGTRIVTGGADATARVWDAESGAEVLALRGHGRTVTSVAFSPDGSRIITVSYDGLAKV